MQVFRTSPWVPAEWIAAHGLEPCYIWSEVDYSPETLPLSAGCCVFAEAVAYWARRHSEVALVLTTTCDQLRRVFDSLTAGGRSRVFLFNVPSTWQTPVAARMYRAEIERLGRWLVALGGRAPTKQEFARYLSVTESARSGTSTRDLERQSGSTHLLRAATRIVTSVPSSSPLGDRLHGGLDSQEQQVGEAALQMPRWRRPFLPHGEWSASTLFAAPSVPLALVGGPLLASQRRLLAVIETAGAHVALDATETSDCWRQWPFKASLKDAGSPLDTLVQQYWPNLVGVFQRPNSRLYAWLRDQLGGRSIRGIILWHAVSCDLWRAEAAHLREAFGLPVLALEADDMNADSPRRAGRIQAFVEMLR